MKNNFDHTFCVAPMMGYTTPHARKLYRILSQKTFLFTEMIASKTMLHSKNKDLIIENDCILRHNIMNIIYGFQMFTNTFFLQMLSS